MCLTSKKRIFIDIMLIVLIVSMVIILIYNNYKISKLKKEIIKYTEYSYQNDCVINGVYQVSLVQLLSNPEKYHEKKVNVSGIYIVGFESNQLFLDEYSYDNNIFQNSLWLSLDEEFMDNYFNELKENIGTFTTIEGVFDAKGSGHMGLSSGEIKHISKFGKIMTE